jgi:predicted small secreted protein
MKPVSIVLGLLIISTALSACSKPAGIDQAMQTASGAMHDAALRAQTAVDPIVETAKDVQKRAQMVKEGIDDINAGKQKIQDGLKH